ncbi:MAG: hypothetical protein CMN17_11545 [Roseovarius sp.]|nr:hypothetical protein [Roseovarius sp.]MBK46087.1 hypothetical protein [Roseovarius sp.]
MDPADRQKCTRPRPRADQPVGQRAPLPVALGPEIAGVVQPRGPVRPADYADRPVPVTVGTGAIDRIESLRLVRGMTEADYARLAPLVAALPPGTALNINTAPPEVLAAVLPTATPGNVARLAGVEAVALRVSFTGDLEWELHVAEPDQTRLYAALLEAGKPLGAGPVGSRALMSLRLEKGYGSWGRDYSPEYWPQECGLAGLIRADKDFLNHDGWRAIAGHPARERMVLLEIDTVEADASGGEPIFLPDGTPAGQVSSGGYGHTVGRSLALAYLKAGLAQPGTALEVWLLGRPHGARVLERPPFDPEGLRQRGCPPRSAGAGGRDRTRKGYSGAHAPS